MPPADAVRYLTEFQDMHDIIGFIQPFTGTHINMGRVKTFFPHNKLHL